MKKLSYLLSLLFVMTLVCFTSCKEDDPEVNQAKVNADKLAGTYTVTNVTRSDDNPIDLGDQDVTLTFGANAEGTGGPFSSTNAAVLPGDTDLPSSGTWSWAGADVFNSIVIGNTTLNLTSALGESPLTFTYTATDAKNPDGFTVTVTATE